MRLYDLKAGMNPRRVRIFLAEKEIEVPTTAIDMTKGENRAPDFLKLNPLGTLPVLELDDGTILTESVAICRYFEFLKPEPNFFGYEGVEQAQVEMWNRRVELELMPPIVELSQRIAVTTVFVIGLAFVPAAWADRPWTKMAGPPGGEKPITIAWAPKRSKIPGTKSGARRTTFPLGAT